MECRQASLEDLHQWRALPSTCKLCDDVKDDLLDLNVGHSIHGDEPFWVYVIPVEGRVISDALAEKLHQSLRDFFKGKLPSNVKVVTANYKI